MTRPLRTAWKFVKGMWDGGPGEIHQCQGPQAVGVHRRPRAAALETAPRTMGQQRPIPQQQLAPTPAQFRPCVPLAFLGRGQTVDVDGARVESHRGASIGATENQPPETPGCEVRGGWCEVRETTPGAERRAPSAERVVPHGPVRPEAGSVSSNQRPKSRLPNDWSEDHEELGG